MNPQPTILLREIRTVEALVPFLHLRYRLFRETPELRSFCPENPERLDIDYFDLHSRHLGLYANDLPVGYTRMITDRVAPLTARLPVLAQRFAIAEKKLAQKPAFPWLSLCAFPEVRQYLGEFIAAATREGRPVAEASRTCIDSSLRSFALTRWLFDCQMAFLFQHLDNWWGFTTCYTKLGALYQRFGMKPLIRLNHNGASCTTYTLHRGQLQPGHLANLERLAMQFRSTGQVVFEPAGIAQRGSITDNDH